MKRLKAAVRLGALVGIAGVLPIATASASVAEQARHPASSHVTITFWDDNGGPRTPIYEHLIPIFERENPGITVKYVGIPVADVAEKYTTAVAGGSPPDMGAVPGQVISGLVGQKALLPLNSLYAPPR